MIGDVGRGPSSGDLQRWLGIGALVGSQSLDVLSTVYGVQSPGIEEQNPIAVSAMTLFGDIFGLVVIAIATMLTVIVITEAAVLYGVESQSRAVEIRIVGYVPMCTISILAAVNNLSVAGVL